MFNILQTVPLIFAITTHRTAAETTEVDVLILGGGIAGVTAANYLDNNDVKSFLILEAQDYIGGRLKNLTVGNTTVSEGANWLSFAEQGDKNPLVVISNILKLDRTESDYEDIVVKNAVGNNTDYEKVYTELIAAQKKVFEDRKKLLQDRPLHSSLAEAGWLADTPLKSVVEWYTYDYEYATGTKTISTKLLAADDTDAVDDIVTDPRGFATIIQYLTQNFTSKIKTYQEVVGVNYTSEGVQVKTSDGSVFRAKYALCTFSTGVLAKNSVRFRPDLPSWKRQAINNLPVWYFTLVIVRFEHVFWDDNEYVFNAGHIRAKFPVILNRNKKGIQPGSNLLMFVAVGDDARRTETQPQSKTVEEVMSTLREMYPGVNISYPTDVAVSKWGTNPYTRGSYSNPVIGSSVADYHNLAGRLGNLFFAGEACDENYYGFLQGGYNAGLKQAETIVKCLAGRECPLYEPEVKDHCVDNSTDCRLINNWLISLSVLVVSMFFYF